jgi:hypothetical protein
MPVKLAELLRGNHLKPVYHSETGVRVLRELARSYLTIVEDQIRVMSRLKRCIAAGRLRVRGETSTTSGIGYRMISNILPAVPRPARRRPSVLDVTSRSCLM